MRKSRTIAMQKVVGSSPISRLREARFWSGFFGLASSPVLLHFQQTVRKPPR
jgi:hypothetical protein